MDERIKNRMDASVYGFNDLENAVEKYRLSGQDLAELLKDVGRLWDAYAGVQALPQ